jgi:hypothetical protein
MGERPLNPVERKTICDSWILHVPGIVITYEVVAKRPAKGDPDNYGKKNNGYTSDNSASMSGRTAELGCAGPESLFSSIRCWRQMFSKAHPTCRSGTAIYSTLATK